MHTYRKMFWVLGVLVTCFFLLGVSASNEEPVDLQELHVKARAMFWVEDLGEMGQPEFRYSDEYEAQVWRVRGENTTVVMDAQFDLMGVEFH